MLFLNPFGLDNCSGTASHRPYPTKTSWRIARGSYSTNPFPNANKCTAFVWLYIYFCPKRSHGLERAKCRNPTCIQSSIHNHFTWNPFPLPGQQTARITFSSGKEQPTTGLLGRPKVSTTFRDGLMKFKYIYEHFDREPKSALYSISRGSQLWSNRQFNSGRNFHTGATQRLNWPAVLWCLSSSRHHTHRVCRLFDDRHREVQFFFSP